MTQPIEEQVADLVAASNQLTKAVENKIGEIDQTVSDALAALEADHKNHIVDGRFDFWYEGTSSDDNGFTTTTMFEFFVAGGTTRINSQLVLPIEGLMGIPSVKFASRSIVVSGGLAGSNAFMQHKIESVKKHAGKTVSISFNAAWDSPKNVAIELIQNFGTGGSPSSSVLIPGKKVAIGTDLNSRYELQFNIPSIVGKTLGTNNDDSLTVVFHVDAGSDLNSRTNSLGNQSGTFDITCIQVEDGSVATKFEEKSKQWALSSVSRYMQVYDREFNVDNALIIGAGQAISATEVRITIPMIVELRSPPVLTFSSSFALNAKKATGLDGFSTNILSGAVSRTVQEVRVIGSGYVAGHASECSVLQGHYIRFDARL